MVDLPTRSARPRKSYDYLIVGAGFAGSVLAERLAAGSGKRVLLIDRRDHVGGNAYDHHDAAGMLIHRYGPHIFHTNSAEIFDYLSRFTAWRPYEHRVLAQVRDKLVPIPINRTTVNALYGLGLQTDEAGRSLPEEPFGAGRSDSDLRGRGDLGRRPRTLRAVLPRLHAQAVGASIPPSWTAR